MEYKVYHREYHDQPVTIGGRERLITIGCYYIPAEGCDDIEYIYGPGTGTRRVVARRQALDHAAALNHASDIYGPLHGSLYRIIETYTWEVESLVSAYIALHGFKLDRKRINLDTKIDPSPYCDRFCPRPQGRLALAISFAVEVVYAAAVLAANQKLDARDFTTLFSAGWKGGVDDILCEVADRVYEALNRTVDDTVYEALPLNATSDTVTYD